MKPLIRKNTASLLYSREGIITETIERSVTIVKSRLCRSEENFL